MSGTFMWLVDYVEPTRTTLWHPRQGVRFFIQNTKNTLTELLGVVWADLHTNTSSNYHVHRVHMTDSSHDSLAPELPVTGAQP
jgi:hypothetical protein